MIEKNEALSELGQCHCLKFRCEPGTGIATKIRRLLRREGAGKVVRVGRGTLGLNSENAARLEDERWPGGFRGTPKVRRKR